MDEYYTVTQFAEITGKDPGNIRRLLACGKMAGEKLGRQWAIPKDAAYPADGRIRTGKYCNWRNRVSIRHNNPVLMHSLDNMVDNLKEIYGSIIVKIVLYGSCARGEQTDESDVDIAVIMNGPADDIKYDRMTDIVVDYEMELGVTLSVLVISADEYYAWRGILPFYKNIDREGIVLWEAA